MAPGKHFVAGCKVQALCKSILGEKVAREKYGADWKTAIIEGIVDGPSLTPNSRKVWVTWSDLSKGVSHRSEIGPQGFISDSSAHGKEPGDRVVNLGRRRRTAQSASGSSDGDSDSEDECKHNMRPLHESGLGGHSLTCCYCSAHACARWYCVQCSTDGQGRAASTRQVRAFCGLGNTRGCKGMLLHIQTGGRSDMQAERRRKKEVRKARKARK
jgi:hypothetical protein